MGELSFVPSGYVDLSNKGVAQTKVLLALSAIGTIPAKGSKTFQLADNIENYDVLFVTTSNNNAKFRLCTQDYRTLVEATSMSTNLCSMAFKTMTNTWVGFISRYSGLYSDNLYNTSGNIVRVSNTDTTSLTTLTVKIVGMKF